MSDKIPINTWKKIFADLISCEKIPDIFKFLLLRVFDDVVPEFVLEMRVVMVRTVVTPSPTRAGVAPLTNHHLVTVYLFFL